jgi:hypothetical protein
MRRFLHQIPELRNAGCNQEGTLTQVLSEEPHTPFLEQVGPPSPSVRGIFRLECSEEAFACNVTPASYSVGRVFRQIGSRGWGEGLGGRLCEAWYLDLFFGVADEHGDRDRWV